MKKPVSLHHYVKKRNGVHLGHPDSLKNMLARSFGANSFDVFWHYWNPIWGFYLSKWVMKPLTKSCPPWLSVVATFAVSGALHDLAITIVKFKLSLLFTTWFVLLGIIVVVFKHFSLHYGQVAWWRRASMNLLILTITFFIAH
ncbi:acyltransferase domain protein [Pseudoalteromonas luteoviolacea B = ATCC 29581]|nr:acyltransferase domain protein [Pseudoalteromonas luteoviolacea B = ATCC 29581]